MLGPSGLVHSETTLWLLDSHWRICFASEGAGLPFGLMQQHTDLSQDNACSDAEQPQGALLADVIGPEAFAHLRATGTATLGIAGSEYRLTLHSPVGCDSLLHIVRLQPADASLAHLISFIVHELRNPLSAMRALAQGLEEELKDESATRTYTTRMIDEIDRLSRLLNSMAQSSRLNQRSEEPFVVLSVIQRVVRLFEYECRQRDVQVQIEAEDPDIAIRGDPDLFTQLFVNLITNGLAAMPAGGILQITLHRSLQGEITLQVQDSGIGMRPEQLEHLLQAGVPTSAAAPATSADQSLAGWSGALGLPSYPPRAKGMGLGLSIVRDIVRQHQGKMHISSAPGHGTSVTIALSAQQPVVNP
jgi:signal transduction histidine kinase